MEAGHEDDNRDHPPGPGDGAQVAGLDGLADVDVPLDSQDKSAPDARIVEQLGHRLHKQLKSIAGSPAPIHIGMAEIINNISQKSKYFYVNMQL